MEQLIEIYDEERALIDEYGDSDVRQLALKIKKSEHVRPKFVLQQIAGRQSMNSKVPKWSSINGLIYPVHLSLEQCSSEATATYKSKFVESLSERMGIERKSFIDLTGGFGVDFAFIGRLFGQQTYVERDWELSSIVAHNLPLLGLSEAQVMNADCEEYIRMTNEYFSLVFIDPARRDKNGGRTVSIEDCTPNILSLETLLIEKADITVVKLSPMLDISESLKKLKSIIEIHVVAVDNECKELLLVLRRGGCGNPTIHTVNILASGEQHFDMSIDEERLCTLNITSAIGRYLYEPNAAIMKSGAFKSIAERYGVKKLQVNSHLYTSIERVEQFPGRVFEVISSGSMGKNTMPDSLRGVEKVNITVRNYPQKVDDIRKKLKLKDGGDDYLFATTIGDGQKIIVHCRPLKKVTKVP